MRTNWRPTPGFAFGGDYNPEQWPRDVWAEDIRLMQEAKVNLVTVGVFSWGLLEVADGVWDFTWLDDILGMLHEGGIAVDLATPTASPPMWLYDKHPEILPVNREGLRSHPGARLQWCPSSAIWRTYATRAAAMLGQRYATHPAVRMWHVSNELGQANRQCFCPESAAAFQRWLAARYGTIEAVNEAWGTAFWGHHYTGFAQIGAPLNAESALNPALVLDFARFSSDALLDHFRAEKRELLDAGVTVPITTNLMVGVAPSVADYASWVDDLDLIANDHYTIAADPRRERDLAFAADRCRGLAAGQPWFLMEHSTGAVNWQVRNRAKAPGELTRNSLAHVARGAEGALFFQWRASRAGSEQWHSAMVPHAGRDTRIWREVVDLGGILDRIGEVAGSVVPTGQVVVIVDDVAGWAWEPPSKPLNDYPLHRIARRWRDAWNDLGVTCDVVPTTADLTAHRIIVVPGLYLVDDATATAITDAAHNGATVVITHLSGIVNEVDTVRLGGYPGAFRNLLGVRAEEFLPLQHHEQVTLDNGYTATDWAESLIIENAEVVARYTGAPLEGRPAITRRAVGSGTAWYVSTDLSEGSIHLLAQHLAGASSASADLPAVPGVEAVRRVRDGQSWLFLLNHTDQDQRVPAAGVDLVSGRTVSGSIELAAGGVAVVREG